MRTHDRSLRFGALLVILATTLIPLPARAQTGKPDVLVIDSATPARPFPHFWEHMFGSERAIVSLRESYRNELRSVKQITDVQYVRFHAIFHDEMGVYDEDAEGKPLCNFSYVDQVYDGLLANGVRPFIELSFMPRKLAARNIQQSFWYKPDVAPPKDWEHWDHLITLFTQHLVNRYGIEEVSRWYFEVWNEPNLDFWGGEPRQSTYWDLYDHTANDIKRVSPRLRVGGPATAQAAWVDAFIQHCASAHVPVDFVSSHVYGNDRSQDVFATNEPIPRDQMVCRAVRKVHDQIQASSLPHLPLIWSEFNASYMNEPSVTDSVYMGPWLADTVRQCDGLVNQMSYWTFSDVFEEQGVVKQPFYGGYGLIAAGGIPKPAYNAFRLLHRLGEERIPLDSNSALLTRHKDGSLSLAVWNITAPEKSGEAKTLLVQFTGTYRFLRTASISRLDNAHGDPHTAYEQMGSPRYPTEAQLRQLRQAAELQDPIATEVMDGRMTITLPPNGLALIEVR